MMHMQVIQEYSNNMHPSSFVKIPVQWSDGVSTGKYVRLDDTCNYNYK